MYFLAEAPALAEVILLQTVPYPGLRIDSKIFIAGKLQTTCIAMMKCYGGWPSGHELALLLP